MSPRPAAPIGFAPPPIDEDAVAAVAAVLRSGWITTGPEVAGLEEDLQVFLGANAVGCFGSWTEAAELVWRWWGLGPGDEVIVPAVTFAATANVVLHCGAVPVVVDVDPSDWNVSAAAIAAAMTPRTKGVMPVDLGGWPVDYAAIREVVEAGRKDFTPANSVQAQLGRPLFFADAAHSFGAIYGGRPVAEQADFTAYSFHAVKNFTTAEGGAVVCALPDGFDRTDILRWMKVWGLHGATRDALAKARGGQWEYDVVGAGYKCNMTDLQAAIGRAQLPKYAAQLEERGELARRYDEGFKELKGVQLPPREDGLRRSAFHLYALHFLDWSEEQRNALIDRLREDGIPTNVHFIPLARLSVHRDRGLRRDDFPMAERHFRGAISLPLHTSLQRDQQDWIVERVVHHATALGG